MYHRFKDLAGLERQCAHLTSSYSPVSLNEAAAWLQHQSPLPETALAVTVDDGYRDFLQAFPIFRAHGIPVTVYLVNEFLDATSWLWVDRLKYAFRRTKVARAAFEGQGFPPEPFDLSNEESRARAMAAAIETAKQMPNSERMELLARLPKILGVEIPEKAPPEFASMTWDEVRQLSAQGGVEFGVHTQTHAILSTLSSPEELRKETEGAKRVLEEKLQKPAAHFCYPNGRLRDIGPRAVEAVRAARFVTAVTTEVGLNYAADDRLLLRRVGVETDINELYFHQCAAAFRV